MKTNKPIQTINFDDFLSREYGKPGTEKRKQNDIKLKKIQAEQIKLMKKKLASNK